MARGSYLEIPAVCPLCGSADPVRWSNAKSYGYDKVVCNACYQQLRIDFLKKEERVSGRFSVELTPWGKNVLATWNVDGKGNPVSTRALTPDETTAVLEVLGLEKRVEGDGF